MSVPYNKIFNVRETPQSEPIPGTTQVANSAGGYSWAVDDWARLDRFLILGSEGGSYYATERKLTIDNAKAVLSCIKADGVRVVKRVVEISDSGRAPKNDAAIFVLALVVAHGDSISKKFATDELPRVARIGTHLFTFLEYAQSFRGWGQGLKKAVSKWYLDKDPDHLAYQMCKYYQRNGWSHRDTLRLAHANPKTDGHKALFNWVTKSKVTPKEGQLPWAPLVGMPQLVNDFIELQQAKSVKDVLAALGKNESLSWEMIPTEYLGDAKVWHALYPRLPMTALIRNLARMTANGTIAPLSDVTTDICKRLLDPVALKKARIHPISVLSALRTYNQGHGERGKLTWDPVQPIVDALDQAFYLSFGNVTPTNKRWCLALDISSSMTSGNIAGVPGLTPRDASAAMALITANVEPAHELIGFSHHLMTLKISPRQRLDDVIRYINALPFGGTDCSLPMVRALQNKIPVDNFVVYTDSETWAGNIHPTQALKQYRDSMQIPAKLVVVGMVANEFTIADPNDAGMMDVVGFDTATPQLIADFGSN